MKLHQLELTKIFAKSSLLLPGMTKGHRSTVGINMEEDFPAYNITVENFTVTLHHDYDGHCTVTTQKATRVRILVISPNPSLIKLLCQPPLRLTSVTMRAFH